MRRLERFILGILVLVALTPAVACLLAWKGLVAAFEWVEDYGEGLEAFSLERAARDSVEERP